MASLLIRNLPESTKRALRKRAAANGRSMEEEARLILGAEMRRIPEGKRPGLGTRLAEIFDGVGPLEIPPRNNKMRKPPFLTDEEWSE